MNSAPQVESALNAAAAVPAASGQLRLRCPACFASLGALEVGAAPVKAPCPRCGFVLTCQDGVCRALAPDREAHFRRFAHDYQAVREREGRGAGGPDFYLRLPYEDTTGRNSWQWRIRGASYRRFEQGLLPRFEGGHPSGLDIVDVGAGNCWLSYRLALRGHRLTAVDLIDNAFDGLGAGTHYLSRLPRPFGRFQAEMDRLPYQDRVFDLAVFNASFHYSEDFHETVREALRCLRRPGHLVIIDSPFYAKAADGERMVEERRALFTKKYGFPSDGIASQEYLTPAAMTALADAYGLAWREARPWYGIRWALRPLTARLRGRRQPSKFRIWWTPVN